MEAIYERVAAEALSKAVYELAEEKAEAAVAWDAEEHGMPKEKWCFLVFPLVDKDRLQTSHFGGGNVGF